MNNKVKYYSIGFLIILSLVGLVRTVRHVRGQPPALLDEPYKSKGNLEAPYSILVFTDFGCPSCRKVHGTLDRLLSEHPTEIRITYKHFPLSYHKHAFLAAEAAECAADQNQFWPFTDKLFDEVYEWAEDTKDAKAAFLKFSNDLGLNTATFSSCLESHTKKPIVENNEKEGLNCFIAGTPTLILNGTRIITRKDYEYLKALISSPAPK